jgi:hypothetical protein
VTLGTAGAVPVLLRWKEENGRRVDPVDAVAAITPVRAIRAVGAALREQLRGRPFAELPIVSVLVVELAVAAVT